MTELFYTLGISLILLAVFLAGLKLGNHAAKKTGAKE